MSLVVVASNDELTIGGMVDACAKLALAIRPTETVVVNDGSSDATWREIVSARDRNGGVGALDLAEKYGREVAMLEGARRASAQLVSFVDGPRIPSEAALAALVAACTEDVVCATWRDADWGAGAIDERIRDDESVRPLLRRVAGGQAVPFAVARREAVVAGLADLTSGASRARVVGLWYAPGGPGLPSAAATSNPSSGTKAKGTRARTRRFATMMGPVALVGAVLIGSHPGISPTPPTSTHRDHSSPTGRTIAFAERNPASPGQAWLLSSDDRPAHRRASAHERSGTARSRGPYQSRREARVGKPGVQSVGPASGGGGDGGPRRSTRGSGNGNGGSGSGTGTGGGGTGGGGGGTGGGGTGGGGGGTSGGGNGGGSGGGGNGGGNGGNGGGNGNGHGHANGHSHAPGQQKKRNGNVPTPQTHGHSQGTHGHSGDHPHGPPPGNGNGGKP